MMCLRRRLLLFLLLVLPLCAMPWLAQTAAVEVGKVTTGLSLTAWLLLTAAGLGETIRRWAQGNRDESRLMRLLMNTTVGWAALSLMLLGMATVGLLKSSLLIPLGLLLGGCFGIGCGFRPAGIDLWREIPWRRYASVLYRRPVRRIAGVTTWMVVLTTVLWSLAPVFDWDAEMYHLPLGQYFLETGGIATHPDNELLNYPGQMHLWYAVGFAFGTDRFAALLMTAATLILSLMAAEFAGSRIGVRAGVWTFIVFWSGAIVTLVAATPRVDPACALFLFAAFVRIAPVLFDRQPIDQRAAVCVGMLLGVAAATKFIGLIGWCVLGAWFVGSCLMSSRLGIGRLLRSGVLIVAVALGVTAPWWIRNWVVWNSPLYPQLPAKTVAAPLSTESKGSRLLAVPTRVVQRTVDVFVNPGRSNAAPNQLPHYIFLAILIVPLLPLKRAIVVIGGVAATYWCLTLAATAMQRHLFALFPMASMLVGYILAWAESRRSPIRLAPAVVVSLTVLTLLLPSRLFYAPALASYLTGAKSEREFRSAISPGLNRATDWLKTNADADAKVLLCWESRVYRIRQPCIADPATVNWKRLAGMADENLAKTKQWLKQQGIEFVLINLGALRYHVDIDGLHTAEELQRVEKQRDKLDGTLLNLVYEGPTISIYRIRD